MHHFTELEERLEGEGADALRESLLQQLAGMERRLRTMMSTPLLSRDEFARATRLATATEWAQRVVRKASAVPPQSI